jgi:hypothetical protein
MIPLLVLCFFDMFAAFSCLTGSVAMKVKLCDLVEIRNLIARSGVLTPLLLRIQVFWGVTL